MWKFIQSKINVVWPIVDWPALLCHIATSVKGKSLGSIISRLAFTCTVYHIWLERNNRVFTKAKIPEEIIGLNMFNMVRFRVMSIKNLKRKSNDLWFLDSWRLPSSILGAVHD